MKVLIYFGTRPEIIKCWPVYNELRKANHQVYLYFTDQHSLKEMKDDIFNDFRYCETDFVEAPNPNVDLVLVQGDTWSVLEGSLFALKHNLKLGHIEAGIRSFDPFMIEERIRKMVDYVSDYLFCPTKIAFNNLNVTGSKYIVGNTIADLLIDKKRNKDRRYILVTLHRPETVDKPEVLRETIKGIEAIAQMMGNPVYFYCHPRTNDKDCGALVKLNPIPYKQMIDKIRGAKLVITDSGGLQEECSILGIPCLTVRKTTERPETIEAGVNELAYNDNKLMIEKAIDLLSRNIEPVSLYGDGDAGEKIVRILEREIS